MLYFQDYFVIVDYFLQLLPYNSHKFAKALKNMALSQVIISVTRPKSGTCLDHCYTSHPAFIANTSVLNIGLADHLPLIIQRKYAKQKKKKRGCESEHRTISYRETNNLDLDELLQSLERIPWDTAFLFEDIDDILNALETMLNEVLDQHLPWQEQASKEAKPAPLDEWWNCAIDTWKGQSAENSPSYKHFNRLVFVHSCKMQNIKSDKTCKTMFLSGNNS